MAPSVKAAAQDSWPGSIMCATPVTQTTVKTTSPIASSPIGRRLARKSRREVNQPAE